MNTSLLIGQDIKTNQSIYWKEVNQEPHALVYGSNPALGQKILNNILNRLSASPDTHILYRTLRNEPEQDQGDKRTQTLSKGLDTAIRDILNRYGYMEAHGFNTYSGHGKTLYVALDGLENLSEEDTTRLQFILDKGRAANVRVIAKLNHPHLVQHRLRKEDYEQFALQIHTDSGKECATVQSWNHTYTMLPISECKQ